MAVVVDVLQLKKSFPRLFFVKEQLQRKDTALAMEVRRILRIWSAFSCYIMQHLKSDQLVNKCTFNDTFSKFNVNKMIT